MSGATLNTTAQSTVDRDPHTFTTILEEGDHPLSSPGRAPESGDVLNPVVVKQQWNGDPMNWESWPTGRPGPFVSESRIQEVKDTFQYLNGLRDEQSRTKDHILHIAEFSSSGRGEFNIYRSSSE